MVTGDEVYTIFQECDQDNDGIVWLSELKQLALNYTSATNEEDPLAEDEDVPLNFDEFCLRFANHIAGIEEDSSAPHPEDTALLDCNGNGQRATGNGHITPNLISDKYLEPSATSSGVSDCSIETDIHTDIPFSFSPEVGFEGYGEASSESDDCAVVPEYNTPPAAALPAAALVPDLLLQTEVQPGSGSGTTGSGSGTTDVSPALSPSGSLRRKNSPFRLSQRRLKRSSAPVVLDHPGEEPDNGSANHSTVYRSRDLLSTEDTLRQQVEDLERKVSILELELGAQRDVTEKLTNEKRDVNDKLLHLEELYRDMEITAHKSDRKSQDTIQDLMEKIDNLKESSEAERGMLSHQITKYEQELVHSHQVKDSLTLEVVKLRDVWALSQEQEAMWENQCNEVTHLHLTKEQEVEALQTRIQRDQDSHTAVVRGLQEQVRDLQEQAEELTFRRRSDTAVGRLQGKVEKIQEENEKLKEMTECILSRDTHSPLALELDCASFEDLSEAYHTMQKDYSHLQSYVDKLLTNIIAEAPHLLCVDHSNS